MDFVKEINPHELFESNENTFYAIMQKGRSEEMADKKDLILISLPMNYYEGKA